MLKSVQAITRTFDGAILKDCGLRVIKSCLRLIRGFDLREVTSSTKGVARSNRAG